MLERIVALGTVLGLILWGGAHLASPEAPALPGDGGGPPASEPRLGKLDAPWHAARDEDDRDEDDEDEDEERREKEAKKAEKKRKKAQKKAAGRERPDDD